ncbi:single-stranded DNA-binding protein [Candidatus Nitromaritima sp. SCGC AAA799-A02]|nr:single-stranded DNA-binding protein [Candidatus Nitromaritima sp. SCGC AAA799-A02]KMP12363.1 single-stranded DNA-binding protein [Candidatus Nitromaritima sp. SCGC AAA799-C22]
MANFNKVLLMGNLTRDPELRYTANGAAVTNLGLAINRKFKQGDEWKEEVCFVDITVWGKQGENCAEYLSKGRPVFVEGRLRFSSWESDGQKRNKLDVVADNVQFLGSRGDNKGGGSEAPQAGREDDVPF